MATASKAAHEETCVARADIIATTLLPALLPAPVVATDENGDTELVGFPACIGEDRANEGTDKDDDDDDDDNDSSPAEEPLCRPGVSKIADEDGDEDGDLSR